MADDFPVIGYGQGMRYDGLARAEIQSVLPAAMPLYELLIERHVFELATPAV